MAQGVKAPATKPFLQKLYTMLEDESAHAIMSWTPNGEAIVVHQPEAFAQQLLPLYFKHNNFSSFVRQLNTYGFNKVDPDAWVFGHPDFKRGAKGTLHLNDIHAGERVLVVDDGVSTGGTLEPILNRLNSMGALLAGVFIIFEKGEGMERLREQHGWALNSLVRLKMGGDQVVLLD